MRPNLLFSYGSRLQRVRLQGASGYNEQIFFTNIIDCNVKKIGYIVQSLITANGGRIFTIRNNSTPPPRQTHPVGRHTPPEETSLPGRNTNPPRQTLPETATAADGTHQTGMHSCSCIFLFVVNWTQCYSFAFYK